MAEVLAVLGRDHIEALLPDVLAACTSPSPFVREGNLTLFRFLPHAIPDQFQVLLTAIAAAALHIPVTELITMQESEDISDGGVAYRVHSCCSMNLPVGVSEMWAIAQEHLDDVLPAILDGLADESEGVRDAALSAGRTAVELFAQTSLPLLLPAVEAGIINDNWRIRQSSVELLGDLLFKVQLSLGSLHQRGTFSVDRAL